MAQKITVTFDVDGSSEVKVEGVAGSGCKAATADLEKALGKTTETKKTHEFNQQAVAGQNATAGGGR